MEGTFPGKITGVAFAPTKNGKAQVCITVQLDSGGVWTRYASLEGGAKDYTVKELRSLGAKGKPSEWESKLVGTKVLATLGPEEYNGRTTTKVQRLSLPLENDPALAKKLNDDKSLDLGEDDIPF